MESERGVSRPDSAPETKEASPQKPDLSGGKSLEQSSEEPANQLHQQAKVEAKDSSKFPPDQHLLPIDLNPEQEEKAVVLQIKQSRLLKRTRDFKEAKARGVANLDEAENLAKDWVAFDAQRNAPGSWFLNKILGQPIDVKQIIDDILPGQSQRLFQEQANKPIEEIDYHKEYQENKFAGGANGDEGPLNREQESLEEAIRHYQQQSLNAQEKTLRALEDLARSRQGVSGLPTDEIIRRGWSLQNTFTDTYDTVRERAFVEAKSRGFSDEQALQIAADAGVNALRDLLEELLRAQEEDDAEVKQEEQGVLRQTINTIFKDNELRNEFATKAQARALAHMGAWTSKYISTEALAQVVTGLLPHHLKELIDTQGVEKTLEILESPDKYGIKGGYYREFSYEGELNREDPLVQALFRDVDDKGETWIRQRIQDVNLKFQLVEASRQAYRSNPENPGKNYLNHTEQFLENDDLIRIVLYLNDQVNPKLSRRNTPHQVIERLLTDQALRPMSIRAGLINEQGQVNPDRIYQFDQFVYLLDRAYQIGQRIHHTFGMSALFDGPRWKEGVDIPEEYWNEEMQRNPALRKAGKNQLVQLNPKVEVEDIPDPDHPGQTFTLTINLRTATDEAQNNPRVKAALKKFRSTRLHISEVMTRSWRNFYRDNYDQLDPKISATSGGRGARELSRLLNYPMILGHSSEAHPGKAQFLRRYAYLNVTSLMEANAYGNAKQLIENWGDDYYYMKKGWANSRLAHAPKFQNILTEEKPRLISSTNTLKDFVHSLQEVKPLIQAYTTEKESGEAVENWLRGLLEFRTKYSGQVDLDNLDNYRIEAAIDDAQAEGLIGIKKHEDIKRDFLAPKWLKALGKYRLFSHEHFPGKFIWKTVEGWQTFLMYFKHLDKGSALFAFISRFFKEIATPPK